MILSMPVLTYVDTQKWVQNESIQREGPKQLKQIQIYLEIIIPYILYKEEPYALTHN